MTSLEFHDVDYQLQNIILCEMRPENWMGESSNIENDKK